MKRVGVMLSGCGFLDGAEIHEAVLTLLALDQRGAKAVCCAPNIEQASVVDHLSHKPIGEHRNVLRESARIARGEILDVALLHASDIDALILPGGFGAAKNLCDFAQRGSDCDVHPGVEKLVSDLLAARKPIGAICIAPGLLARIAAKHGLRARLTIGDDAGTARQIAATGCLHEPCSVSEICVDRGHKLVSTPAYMLGRGPAPVFEGIRKLVDEVLALI